MDKMKNLTNKQIQGDLLKNCANNLKILSNCTKSNQKRIIKGSDKKFMQSLKDCILNVLEGNIRLCEKDKKKLKNYKYTLRKIVQNKALKKNKDLIIQKGGFLSIILPGAITLLNTLIDILQKK